MPDLSPIRGRFHFRLGTLLIVVTLLAVACAYIGSQLKFARERNEAVLTHAWVFTEIGPKAIPEAPWPLRWFGEEACWGIDAGEKASDEEVANLIRLFPEAVVYRGEVVVYRGWEKR